MDDTEKTVDAVQAARMYYYQNMTTEAIAHELNMSRSTISRLLSYARRKGLVDIRIVDPNEHPQQFEKKIIDKFKINRVHVVPVPDIVGEAEWLERAAQYTANYWNSLFDSNMILGIAWNIGSSAFLLVSPTFGSGAPLSIQVASVAFALGLSCLWAWIIRRLASANVRAEFD